MNTLTTRAVVVLLCVLLLTSCAPHAEQEPPTPAASTPVANPDTTQPRVTSLVPHDGEHGTGVDAIVTITFSEPIDQATVNSSTFTVADTGQHQTTNGTISFDGSSAVFTPSEPLQFGSQYTVVVTDAISDYSGNNLADSTTSYFWTQDLFAVSPAPPIELKGFSGGSFFSAYVVFDVNGDAFDDLVYGGAKWVNDAGGWVDEPAEFTVLLNAGEGRFRKDSAVAFPAGTPALVSPRDAKSADFNGDARDDMFFVGHGYDDDPWPGEENLLLLSQPNGSFLNASSQLDNPVSGFTHSCAVGDIDNDGDLDLVAVDIWGGSSPPAIYTLVNDGLGQFASRKERVSGGSSMRWTAAELVDLDNDEFVDLVLGEDGSRSMSAVLWNNGDGNFAPTPTVLPSPDPYLIVVDILPIDLNSDGYQDLVLSATKESPFYEGQYLQALVNDGNRAFVDDTPTHFPSQDTRAKWSIRLESPDLDLDGDLDLVTLYDSGPSDAQPIWFNNGDGVFSQLPALAEAARGTMVPIDVDADGDMDFLTLRVEFFGTQYQTQHWTTVINNTR